MPWLVYVCHRAHSIFLLAALLIDASQIGNSSANIFPTLLLAGSSETHLVGRGAFQELDAISLLTPHTKLAIRPPTLELTPSILYNAYRVAWHGRPGASFVDLPADLIQGNDSLVGSTSKVSDPPRSGAEEAKIFKVAQLLRNAKAPLIVVGKGAAYARAEIPIRELVEQTQIPFLPTPMGKGVLPDSHPLNTASARSAALKNADVVLLLGSRLNWILHFGDTPKWNPNANFIQADIAADEIGRNSSDPSLGLVGDVSIISTQLSHALQGWTYKRSSFPFFDLITSSATMNEATAARKASESKLPFTYPRAFDIIKRTLHSLSPPEDGGIVYVSEGANTMDISRSIFPVSYPRLRLDAGTYATMGVGLGYAIAAHCAYNFSSGEGHSGPSQRKKVVCLEGDSAFGFSAMEVETMSRYGMDVLIFVVNNGGVYHGDSDDADSWLALRQNTVLGKEGGLRSTSLGWEVGYEKLAQMCGGEGWMVRTERELEEATRKGFESDRVCVVNVMVEAGKAAKLEFGWQASSKHKRKEVEPKL